MEFILKSDYKMTGDQLNAAANKGFYGETSIKPAWGTGSGKPLPWPMSYKMSKTTLVISHNKTLRLSYAVNLKSFRTML